VESMSNWYDEIEYLKNRNITDIKNYIDRVVNNIVDMNGITEECYSSLENYYISRSDKFIEEIIVGLIWDDISNQLNPFIREENYNKINVLCDEMGLNAMNVNIIGNHSGVIKNIFVGIWKDREII
jgi:hypothetical protein